MTLITDQIFDLIVDETNRYAEQCSVGDSSLATPRDVDGNEHMANSKQMKMFLKKKNGDGNSLKTYRQEIMAFFGLMIFMGYHKLPHADKYEQRPAARCPMGQR